MRSRWCELWIVMVAVSATFVSTPSAHAWDEVWQSMGDGLDNRVNAITVYNGELIAGGTFTTSGGQTVNGVARWNGASWQPLGGGVSGGGIPHVNALTVYNGQLIAAGQFTTAGGVSANNIARWNGTTWQPLGIAINSSGAEVYALTVFNGELIAGGEFVAANGVTANNIARWNGSQWSRLIAGGQTGVNDEVDALTVWNNQLIVGGQFTTAGGQTMNRIASWNGTGWAQFIFGGQIGVDNQVLALAEWNGDLIAGGRFLTAGGQTVNCIVQWNGSAWQSLTSGNQVGVSSRVYSLTSYNGELIVGGTFLTAGNQVVNHVARWNGTAWQPGLGSGMNSTVYALREFNDELIAGGDFTTAGGVAVGHIARTSANSIGSACPVWSSVGAVNGYVRTLTEFKGDLIAGGAFSEADGQIVNSIARWNGADWLPLASRLDVGVENPVSTMTVWNSDLYIGGVFTTAGGIEANYIARWDGADWHPLGVGGNIGVDGDVSALIVWNSHLIAGGTFISAGGQTVNGIARWDGSTWHPFESGGQVGIGGRFPAVVSLMVWNGDLIAGGYIETAGGQTMNNIARWDGSAWHPMTSGGQIGVDDLVQSLAVWNGNLIAGGYFFNAGGQTVNQIARWDGLSWHSLTSGGQIGVDEQVSALTVWNGDLIASGTFTHAGGQPVNNVAVWVGLSWRQLFGTVMDNGAYAFTIYNGRLTAGGAFISPVSYIGQFDQPSVWLSPQAGAFSSNLNWEYGYVPDAPTFFGLTSGASPFAVTFREAAQSKSLCITNQQPVLSLNGATYDVTDSITVGSAQTAQLTINSGTLNASVIGIGTFGTLAGDGAIFGNIASVGTVRPGNSALTDGSLTLTGNYTQTFGIFNPRIGSSEHGRLDVTNNASIAGTLKVELTGSPVFEVDQQFPILTCGGTLTGTFDVALLPLIGDDLVMTVQYSSGAGGGASDGGTDGSGGVTIIIAQPNGNPDFGDPDTFTLEGEPTGVTGARIGNLPAAQDLALSIAALNPLDPGNALILLNQGDGSAFTPIVIPVGREPSDIASANLADGGTADDLAVPNRGDDNVTVMFHEGAGSYALLNVPVGDAPSAIATEDFRGLGRNDLAVTNSGGDSVTILLNNGDRTFTALPVVNVGAQPQDIAAAPLVGSAATRSGRCQLRQQLDHHP